MTLLHLSAAIHPTHPSGGLHSHAPPLASGAHYLSQLDCRTSPALGPVPADAYLSDSAHDCSQLSGGRNRQPNTPVQWEGELVEERRASRGWELPSLPFLGLPTSHASDQPVQDLGWTFSISPGSSPPPLAFSHSGTLNFRGGWGGWRSAVRNWPHKVDRMAGCSVLRLRLTSILSYF